MEMYQGHGQLKRRIDKFYLKGSEEVSQRRCPLNWAEQMGSAEQF